ncbi:MAG: AAA family ATPase, partial [Methanomassiliicoccaceae archaeon]|nr:AAA family ATPase [Methanomassiliicoccaceae archaeon]
MQDTIVRRDHYLNIMREFKDEPLVKIITGIRRCGKSTLMEMFVSDLKENGVPEKSVIHMNFEDHENSHITDNDMLLNEVKSKVELKKGTYLFFDEIQDIIGWEKAINSMRYSGADVYITGS